MDEKSSALEEVAGTHPPMSLVPEGNDSGLKAKEPDVACTEGPSSPDVPQDPTPQPAEAGDREEDERLGGIIHFFCIAISLGLVICMIHPFLTREIFTVGTLIFEELALVVVLWLNGRGSHLRAMRLLTLSLLVTVTTLILARGNGTNDAAVMAFPAVIVAASLLLNKRWFIAITLASILCFTLIFMGQLRNVPPLPAGLPRFSPQALVQPRSIYWKEWLDAVVFLGLTSILAGLITQYLKQNLLRAKEHEASLAKMNADLKRQTDHLSNYQEILEGISEAILVAEVSKGLIVESNRAAVELFGFSPEELSQLTLAAFCQGSGPLPEDKAAEWTRKTLASGTQVYQTQCWKKSGEMFWAEVELRCTNIGGEGRLLGVVRDYTLHRKAEEELKESEARFFSLAQASFEGVAIVDEGIIVAANDKYTSIHGYEADEIIGMKMADLMPEGMAEFLLEKEDSGKEALFETEAVRKDGSRFPVEIRAKYLPYNGRLARVAAIRDISERKSLQEQFRQAQKMDAFGQLAGGVAHDFNNLLTVILSHTSMMQMRGNSLPLEEQAQSVQEIADAAERATNLTRQLLTFSRRQKMERQRVDLNEVVRNMTKMLKRILGEKIALQANCSDGFAPVYADAGMLEQVLLNLAVNSRDAMPGGGYLILQTDVVQVSPEDLEKHPGCPEGNYIRLSVTDTGAGIAPENLSRIFEPFFTTKGVGKGTGLGLATVFGIVEQHQGWVEVQSRVGSGTTFQIYLPQGSGNVIRRASRDSQEKMEGGQETILLAEDEEGVRELTAMVLKTNGYQILEAANAYEALEIWKEYHPQIDMLFTDLIMPGDISGCALAALLLKEKPSLKVIYSSGYTDETLGPDAFVRDQANFLQKPFDLVRLTKVVRAALDGKLSRSEDAISSLRGD